MYIYAFGIHLVKFFFLMTFFFFDKKGKLQLKFYFLGEKKCKEKQK